MFEQARTPAKWLRMAIDVFEEQPATGLPVGMGSIRVENELDLMFLDWSEL